MAKPIIKFVRTINACNIEQDGVLTRIIKDPYPDIDVIDNAQQIVITPNVGANFIVDKNAYDIILPGESAVTTKTIGEIATALSADGFFKVEASTGLSASEVDAAIDGKIALIPNKTEFVRNMQGLGSEIKSETVFVTFVHSVTGTGLLDGTIYVALLPIHEAGDITGLMYHLVTSAVFTPNNENRLGLYHIDPATGDCTLVAATANDGSIWTAAEDVVHKKAFAVPYTAPSSGFYYAACLYNNDQAVTGTPTIPQVGSLGADADRSPVFDLPNGLRVNGTLLGATLPASFNVSELGGTNNNFWFGLY